MEQCLDLRSCPVHPRVERLESGLGSIGSGPSISRRLYRLELLACAAAVMLVPVAVAAMTWLLLLPYRILLPTT